MLLTLLKRLFSRGTLAPAEIPQMYVVATPPRVVAISGARAFSVVARDNRMSVSTPITRMTFEDFDG